MLGKSALGLALSLAVAVVVLPPGPALAQDVTVAAAGDIARDSLATPQQQTADLVTGYAPTAVLALGDEQYQDGSLADYNAFYNASWGAFRSITHPVQRCDRRNCATRSRQNSRSDS